VQSYLLKIVRSYVMTSQFIEPLRVNPNFFDVAALFEAATGVPLEVYQALTFGAMTRFIKLDDIKKSNDLASFAVPATWFRSTTGATSADREIFRVRVRQCRCARGGGERKETCGK